MRKWQIPVFVYRVFRFLEKLSFRCSFWFCFEAILLSTAATSSHFKFRGGRSNTDTATNPVGVSRKGNMTFNKSEIQIVFSDVDGTLVHYPDLPANLADIEGNRLLHLPPSSTGMQGIISSRTLLHCQEWRRSGKKLVLVSGMRTATLMKRLPYLPRADAYCSEAGGRIFFPVTDTHSEAKKGKSISPLAYDGCNQDDLAPFCIEEDIVWRRRMERVDAAGRDGFAGALLTDSNETEIPVLVRKGLLWEFAQNLINKGYVLDTKGYSACFRVNQKQQNRISDVDFQRLSSSEFEVPSGLASSVNLGCVDFYPIESGKKNCCLYLAKKFCNTQDDSVLSKHAVCFCDDDNDLEMAMACHHAFVPGISSQTMKQMIHDNPDQLTLTEDVEKNINGVAATEAALELVLKQFRNDRLEGT